ncbi:farnesyltranstransferase [Candidatus Aerophobetes bacterium]|uniref:Farnesyltranstransferase n=1 Tax=Aerophobetes bacterium TaxID=2030807 RepID=A0A2A4YDE2_UNCAE|nr:MAG: farnesyltranstransferase [Candidatus Aerophobetes bacterium]
MSDAKLLKQTYVSLINHRLNELVDFKPLPQKELFEAAKYSLLAPCKRLRPLFVLSILHGYGTPLQLGLDPACAIEMIHTYSLIHDDLPCMDNDDLRRGRPSLHKVYPEGLAVLAGDFLLTYAFEIITTSAKLSNSQKLDLITILSKRSGAKGMIGGQVVDLASEGQSIGWDTLHFMHLHKTAALFTACLEFGGILADVPKVDRAALLSCGRALGVAFQVIDDLLDEPSQKMGSDFAKEKATTVSMLGIQKSEEKAKLLLDEAFSSAKKLSKQCSLLNALIKELYSYIPSLSY